MTGIGQESCVCHIPRYWGRAFLNGWQVEMIPPHPPNALTKALVSLLVWNPGLPDTILGVLPVSQTSTEVCDGQQSGPRPQ